MSLLSQLTPKYYQLPSKIMSPALRYLTSSASEENHQKTEPDKLYKILELELRCNEPATLNSFSKFATMTGNHLNLQSKTWNLRKPVHERYTVLKSAHVHKKHRVQYEHRTYFTFVQFKHLTGSTMETLLEYLERNLPEGVALKATTVELQKLADHFVYPEEKRPKIAAS